jgi:flagellar biogenesis protein FliO
MAQLPDQDEEQVMKQCVVKGCTSTMLVYSGVAAFLLGVETETICYDHANEQAQAREKEENNGN